VLALDFQFDETAAGRRLKLLNIVDEHTREALAMRVARHCTAADVVTELTGLVATRGAPQHLRMDNGRRMIAWALRDYCRLAGARTAFIEAGSPWQNPFIESFNGRVRDELLNVEEFPSLTVAQVVCRCLAHRGRQLRPHSALGGRPPPSTRPAGPAHPTSALVAAGPLNGGPVRATKACSSTAAAPVDRALAGLPTVGSGAIPTSGVGRTGSTPEPELRGRPRDANREPGPPRRYSGIVR
jgi:hypothetical protein